MNCPNCGTQVLETQRCGEIDVERCPGCGGWWFDALELERILLKPPRDWLLQDLRSPTSPTDATDRRLVCPRCEGTGRLIRLNSLERPGTIIDSCSVCFGCWVDAGELSHIAREDTVAAAIRRLFHRQGHHP